MRTKNEVEKACSMKPWGLETLFQGVELSYGAGRNRGNHNLLNCYVIIPEDSVDSIGKTIQDMYRISCAGGGVGFNVSKIRPRGDHIGSVKNSAPGCGVRSSND